jgi:hypothetical protein
VVRPATRSDVPARRAGERPDAVAGSPRSPAATALVLDCGFTPELLVEVGPWRSSTDPPGAAREPVVYPARSGAGACPEGSR